MDRGDVEPSGGLHDPFSWLFELLCHAARGALGGDGTGKVRWDNAALRRRAKWNGVVKIDPSSLEIPRKWKRGRLIFVNSMSDLFHDGVPLAFIRKVFEVMEETPQHTYQVLTKRAERLEELSKMLPWPANVWMGVSVESAEYLYRIGHPRRTKAKTKFLSLEPLLGPLDKIDLTGMDWAIAGGESGPGARPMPREWIRSIRDQCVAAEVPFHFKQWGGKNKKKAGRLLDGRTWDEWPNTKRRRTRSARADVASAVL